MIRGALPAVLLLTLLATPVRAQSFDYTAAEQMLGEPVTTSVIGKPQRVSEAPASMEILTAADIRRSGANNLPDILRYVAGIDVRRYGTQDTAVGIRGYNTALNPRVLVLLDGRQVYQDDYGMTVWSLIPVALGAIRQIEIIKGPNSALYGFNAVSGVINIVTVDPLRDKVNEVRIDGGTQNQAYGEFVTTAQVPGQFGARLSATGFRSSEFGINGGQNSMRQQPHSGTAAADVRIQLAPGVQWDLSGSIGSVDSEYYIDVGSYAPVGFKANSVRSRLSADTSLGVLQLDAYRNGNHGSNNLPTFSRNWQQDVTVLQASDLVKLGYNHTIRVAAEYRNNASSSLQTFSGRSGYTLVAGSAMWDWQITPRLTLTNAVRLDYVSLSHDGPQVNIPGGGDLFHSVTFTEPSYNSGLVFKVTDTDTVRLTAAKAIQLPSLVDFGLAYKEDAAVVLGNTGLRASAVQNYGLDYDRRVPSIGSTIRIAAFMQRTDTTIGSPFGSSYTFLPTGQPLFQARNFGSSSMVGGEIGLKGSSASGLRWNISYALAAVRDDTAESLLLAAPSISYQRQTPTHSVILGGGYTRGRFESDFQMRWQSHIQDFRSDNVAVIQPVTVSNYVTVRGRISYRVTDNATVSLVGEQLNSHRLAETAGRLTDRRLLASLQLHF